MNFEGSAEGLVNGCKALFVFWIGVDYCAKAVCKQVSNKVKGKEGYNDYYCYAKCPGNAQLVQFFAEGVEDKGKQYAYRKRNKKSV